MLKVNASGGELDFVQNLGKVRQALIQVQNKIQRSTPRVKTPPKPEKIDKSVQTLEENVAVKIAEVSTIVKSQQQQQQYQQQSSNVHLQQQPMSVIERLELKFLKQTITQYNEDTYILYNNFMDSLKVIEVLKKKIEDQNKIIHSSFDQVKIEYMKLQHSHNAKLEEIKNLEKITFHWKRNFEVLKESVKQSAEEDILREAENERLIQELTSQNRSLREMMSISFSEEMLKKVQTKIEEAESDFYNNKCSKNPQPSDLEIKFLTSNNKGMQKGFKKFGVTEKSVEQASLETKKQLAREGDPSNMIVQKQRESSSNEGGKSNLEKEQISGSVEEQSSSQVEKTVSQDILVKQTSETSSDTLMNAQKPTQVNTMSTNELKVFQENSSKLQKIVKKLEMETQQQQEQTKQAQLRLLGNFRESGEDDEEEHNNEDEDEEEGLDDAEILGEIRVEEEEENQHLEEEEEEEEEAGDQVNQKGDKIITDFQAEETRPQQEQQLAGNNSKTQQQPTQSMGFQLQGREGVPLQHEDNEEEEEDEEEQEDADPNPQQNYSNLRQNESAGWRQQQQSQQIDFKDRARVKELLLMQSKQFSQQISQMSNPKFFKPSQGNSFQSNE